MLTERKYTKSPFTAEEDRMLSMIVDTVLAASGGKRIDWNFVASQMMNRNARQCKDRWEGYLDTKINRNEFTTEENYFILKKVDEIGKKWKIIASLMKHRTDVAVKAQYRKLVRRNITTDNVFYVPAESYQMKQRSSEELANSEISSPLICKNENKDDPFVENDFIAYDEVSLPQERMKLVKNQIKNSQEEDSMMNYNFESLFSLENGILSPFEQEIFSENCFVDGFLQ